MDELDLGLGMCLDVMCGADKADIVVVFLNNWVNVFIEGFDLADGKALRQWKELGIT